MLNPTDEQQAAADAFHAGDHLALQAGAGTGKTTTLALLAHATPRRGRYLAYNRAIAQDAAARFPATVTLQDRPRPRLRRRRPPLHPPPERPPPPGLADRTGPRHHQSHPHRRTRPVTNKTLSNAALRTVTRFCHTADRTPSPATTSRACAAWKTATCTPNSPPTSSAVRPQSLGRPPAPRRRRRPLRPRPLPEDLGPHRARRSTPTSCSSTRPRTPTPSSNRSSSPSATTPSW